MAPTPSIDNDTATILQETVCELTTTTTSVQQYRRKAWSLCSEYLGGDWSTVLLDEFRLKTVKGGLSSLLFLAELPNSKRTKDTIHHQVLVRLRLDEDPEYTHHESLIFNILSERKMGPKLLGSFKDGRLEEFIPSRCLYCNEISLPRVARQVASLMVQVHCLQMPVSKKPNHMRITRSWLKKLEDKIGQADLALYHTQATVDPKDYPKIISVDTLLTELEFLEEFMKQSGSPVVFCHNDFSPANTLLKDGGDVNGNIDSEANSLMLIDFEFSDYNYRGFDLGQFFCCPGLDFSLTPYTFDLDKMECPDLRDTFCNAYLDEAYKAKTRLGNDFPTNLVTGNRDMDMAQLKIEADCYTALSCFFFGSWALSQAYIRKDEGTFNYHQYGRDRICAYYRQKRHILEFLGRL